MLISIYNSSLPSPRTAATLKTETHSGVMGKTSTDNSSSAGAPKLNGNITQQHGDNSLLCDQFIHLWTNIVAEFTQYVRRTPSTPGESTTVILVSNLLCLSYRLSLFFLISPFSSAIYFLFLYETRLTASVVQWSEFLATDTEVPGSIPGATRFSEQQWVWNGVHSAS